MTGFLPDNYKRPEPSAGNYAKLEDGQNRYRILSEARVGWLYWTEDNKPVRLKEKPEALPADMRGGDKLKLAWVSSRDLHLALTVAPHDECPCPASCEKREAGCVLP